MRTLVVLFGLLMAGTAFAQASDPTNFNINCRFRSPKVGRCHVVANVHLGTGADHHLLVNCSGPGVEYNGDANVSAAPGGVFVGADVEGGLPGIALPEAAFSCEGGNGPSMHDAELILANGLGIPGRCQVVAASCPTN